LESSFLGRILIVSTSKRYPDELKARAIRIVLEHRAEYPSQYAAVKAVAERLDIGI
jgi:transposase